MDFALGYLAQRFVFRIKDFFVHWYGDGSVAFWRFTRRTFRRLDRSLAFTITLRNLFRPLYGDYSIVGRIIGPFFRLCRVLIGAVVYIVLAFFLLLGYLIWLMIPLYLLYFILHGLGSY